MNWIIDHLWILLTVIVITISFSIYLIKNKFYFGNRSTSKISQNLQSGKKSKNIQIAGNLEINKKDAQ